MTLDSQHNRTRIYSVLQLQRSCKGGLALCCAGARCCPLMQRVQAPSRRSGLLAVDVSTSDGLSLQRSAHGMRVGIGLVIVVLLSMGSDSRLE